MMHSLPTPRPTILLTDPIHADAHARLATDANIVVLPDGLSCAESEAALRTLLADADGLIVRRQLPENLFDARSHLCGVVMHGVGLDFIPVAQASVWQIPVANAPAVNANAVAEYAFAAMFAMSRQLAHFDHAVRQGNWQARRTAVTKTFDLRGRTLGVIGYGAIGRRIGEIATQGFSMKVVAHTTTPARLPAHVGALSLEELFATSDFLVVACPLTPQTRGMIDRHVIAHAKPGAVLINVGRGPVICEEDLRQCPNCRYAQRCGARRIRSRAAACGQRASQPSRRAPHSAPGRDHAGFGACDWHVGSRYHAGADPRRAAGQYSQSRDLFSREFKFEGQL